MGKLRSIAKLSVADHIAFTEAILSMGWARVLITFVPMRHWHQQVSTGHAVPADPMDEATITRVARAVKRVGRNSPVHFVCLPQAIAARWMLRRRGIETNLFIGTHKYAGSEETHKFHAWLKVGERWVTGRCNERDYAIFSREPAKP